MSYTPSKFCLQVGRCPCFRFVSPARPTKRLPERLSHRESGVWPTGRGHFKVSSTRAGSFRPQLVAVMGHSEQKDPSSRRCVCERVHDNLDVHEPLAVAIQ